MTKFWLRDNLYRDTAPVPIYKLSATETTSQPLSKLIARQIYNSENLYQDGKKMRHPATAGTFTYFIAGPLGFIAEKKQTICIFAIYT
jgi:hypothetical protein